ncbi:uncharacterized protein [Rutidosis leptorrhynchoides]|uniref:uncharacterized protein n=1 Tax=Rutidosis leptorrhynchoides TaxID=125765 RepID=UPI003A99AB8E
MDENGTLIEGRQVADVFVRHYTNFLGSARANEEISIPGTMFTERVDQQHALHMIRDVTTDEIKAAVFDIGDNIFAGPDGFSSAFFKKSWDIIGEDVVGAVKEFSRNGQMLKENNSTIIALMPKVQTPSKELMRNYHLDRGTSRCAFKVDIQKAYDTVNWDFLEEILICFGFHKKFIKWIMTCVSTTSYMINVNGELHGFYKGKRGLRQGDRMSPYQFTLVMELKNHILSSLQFEEGKLPIRYLGVPLVSSRLYNRDCKLLIERVRSKVNDWKKKYLSFAGRVQLIISGDMKRGKVKVKWKDLCVPKNKGGLGIKSMKHWNSALMTRHIWSLLSMKQSIWPNLGPLALIISVRDIYDKGFHFKIKVNEVLHDFVPLWPDRWYQKYPILHTFVGTVRMDRHQLVWKQNDDAIRPFSIGQVWDSIRPHKDKVAWYSVIWYSQCIPRHTFLMWLLVGERLKTHDKLKAWDRRDDITLVCSLCKSCSNSHDHLFFECKFSTRVWKKVSNMLIHPINSIKWRDILESFIPDAHRNLARIVVSKLCFAASVYFIWQERNNRIFKGVGRSEEKLFEIIFSMVRLKLMTIKFKDSDEVKHLKSS